MAYSDKGMKLSVKGLGLTGEQIVKFDNGRYKDVVFKLNDGNLSSFRYNPLVDVGFSSTSLGQAIHDYVLAQALVLPTSKIMEIAGGDTLKLRYDNGVCVIVDIKGENSFIMDVKHNVARVTKNNYYTIPDGSTSSTAVPYYKSGGGTAQLVPLLTQDGDTVGDIVSVFEGKDGDHIVRLSDVTTDPIIGFVGGLKIIGAGTNNSIVTPNGNVAIDGFGTIYRHTEAVDDILLTSTVPTGDNTPVDYSTSFSPIHYNYIENHRVDWKNNWSGLGKTGHIVDNGQTFHMKVSAHGVSSVVGEPDRVSSPALNDDTPFVMIGEVMHKVDSNGVGDVIDTVKIDGDALISYIYTHDMSEHLVIGNGLSETEPFAVNGYSFGYVAGRLVDVQLDAL